MVNPIMARKFAAARQNMTAPESVMDERYPAWKKSQDEAEKFMVLADLATAGVGAAPLAGRGLLAAGRSLAPVAGRMAENYMGDTGMLASILPRKSFPDFTGPLTESELASAKFARLSEDRSVGLSGHDTTTPRRIQNETRNGGYSVSLPSGDVPSNGLMMGKYANADPRNRVLDASAGLTRDDILEHARVNAKAFSAPENHLGTWRDPETGKIYLDVSRRFEPDEIRKATKFGERTGQLAGWDKGKGAEIPVGNWNEFIRSPEFIGPEGRLAQMEKTGAKYLTGHPTGDWWDIRGSLMEKIYGKDNLPQVAGYTASTAPVSAPRENIQTMSEYMRRHIKGEPAIQPDWRVPPGMMTRQEGVQIGMEQSRANNLRRSSLGDYTNLSGKKVGEEGRALMGDPNAVVLDRHQIRVSEDPARGIYASGQPDIVSEKNYDALKQAITDYANAHSIKNPNRASADIWTGIRETIKTKSDLFGTKFQGSAVTGDSKSYIDHFDDLINDKAKHLGISRGEMEKRLSSGDANLLSAVLATPVGAAIFAAWQAKDAGQASD